VGQLPMLTPRIASCESCGQSGPVPCSYTPPDGSVHLFCTGKCLRNWELTRNGLPSPGIATSLSHAPGQERG